MLENVNLNSDAILIKSISVMKICCQWYLMGLMLVAIESFVTQTYPFLLHPNFLSFFLLLKINDSRKEKMERIRQLTKSPLDPIPLPWRLSRRVANGQPHALLTSSIDIFSPFRFYDCKDAFISALCGKYRNQQILCFVSNKSLNRRDSQTLKESQKNGMKKKMMRDFTVI